MISVHFDANPVFDFQTAKMVIMKLLKSFSMDY